MADPYNQAVDIHDRMGALLAQPRAFARELLSVVGLCQLAIHRNPQHSRAHIMLADAYNTASALTDDPQGREYFLVLAIAMMTEWRIAPTIRPVSNWNALRFLFNRIPTRGRKVEDETAGMVVFNIMNAEMEHFFGPSIPDDPDEVLALRVEFEERLHDRFIELALDPGEVPQMAALLGVAEG